MGVTVKSRSFETIFDSAPLTFLKGNENSIWRYKTEIEVDFNFKSTSNDLVQFSDSDELTRVNGAWGDKGFVIGDSVTIEYIVVVDPQDPSQNINVSTNRTILDIIGNVMVFSANIAQNSNLIGSVAPSTNQLSSVEIKNNTRSLPESLNFYVNLNENGTQGSINSLIDGEVNRFRYLGIDTLSVGNSVAGVQLGDKSGGAFDTLTEITRTGDQSYEIEITIFNWLRYDQAEFVNAPEVYDANGSIKPFFRFEAKAQENNPNAILKLEDNAQIGNVGWIGENYNQGLNNFSLVSFANEDNNGDPLQGLDYGQQNNIKVVVLSNGTIDENKFVLLFQHLPIDGYKNTPDNFNQNTYSSYIEYDGTANEIVFNKGGAEMVATFVSRAIVGSNLEIEFTLTPNAALTTAIENKPIGDRFYRITGQFQDDSQDNAAVIILSQGQLEKSPIVGTIATEVESLDFFNHAMELGVDPPLASLQVMTEDDILCHSVLSLEKSENYEAFRISFRVVENATGQFFNLFQKEINLTTFPTDANGKQLINYSLPLNLDLPNPDRNVFSLKLNGNETSTTYEVEMLHTMILSWRYWDAKPNALAAFLDANLPNNGLNDEWVRYAQSGYSFLFRIELVKNGVADFFNSQPFIIDNYDSQAVTSAITFEDVNGNSLPAPLLNDDFVVIATHTAPSPWSVGDLWGWIAQRPFESEKRKLISTKWSWGANNLPLRPLQGLSLINVTINNNIAVFKALVEGSQLQSGNTFVSRIQSPIFESCESPLIFFFGWLLDNATDENHLVELMDSVLRVGFTIEGGICCPNCVISDDPELKGFAFLNPSIVGELSDAWQNEPCCSNTYDSESAEDDCMNNTAFDAVIDDIFTLIGGQGAMPSPMVINSYFHANYSVLKDILENITTNENVRFDIFELIINKGLQIICDEDGVTTFSYIQS